MFREDFPSCPACEHKLDPVGPRLRCGGCEGVLVPYAQLTELFSQMTPDDDRTANERVRPRSTTTPPRACPRCKQPMAAATLEQIEVDACTEHGVWFDINELGWVLEMQTPERSTSGERGRPPPLKRAGLPEPPPRVKTWWQKFFGY